MDPNTPPRAGQDLAVREGAGEGEVEWWRSPPLLRACAAAFLRSSRRCQRKRMAPSPSLPAGSGATTDRAVGTRGHPQMPRSPGAPLTGPLGWGRQRRGGCWISTTVGCPGALIYRRGEGGWGR
jgi:hypothetical protein